MAKRVASKDENLDDDLPDDLAQELDSPPAPEEPRMFGTTPKQGGPCPARGCSGTLRVLSSRQVQQGRRKVIVHTLQCQTCKCVAGETAKRMG